MKTKKKNKEIDYTNRDKKPLGFGKTISGLTSLFYNLVIAQMAISFATQGLKKVGLLKGK